MDAQEHEQAWSGRYGLYEYVVKKLFSSCGQRLKLQNQSEDLGYS